MKYRKKPVVIDAWCISAPEDKAANAPIWLAEAIVNRKVEMVPTGGVIVHTLEGDMLGWVGDWLIRGVKGEFYPVKPDIFAATYEAVEPCSISC